MIEPIWDSPWPKALTPGREKPAIRSDGPGGVKPAGQLRCPRPVGMGPGPLSTAFASLCTTEESRKKNFLAYSAGIAVCECPLSAKGPKELISSVLIGWAVGRRLWIRAA